MDKNVIFHPFTDHTPHVLPQKRYLRMITTLTLAGKTYTLAGGEDEDLHLWDVSGLPTDPPRSISTVEGHSGEISSLVSLGGRRGQGWVALSTSLDGTIRRWTAQGEYGVARELLLTMAELLEPKPLVYERKKEETGMTEEEERELAELMSDDE